MPSVTSGAASLEYEAAGPVDAPACLLLHSLGTTRELWEPQWSVLVKRYRVMRYDVRGHGGSQPPVGPYTLEQLGRDALADVGFGRTTLRSTVSGNGGCLVS